MKDESRSEDLNKQSFSTNKAIEILQKGGVIIFPTDTVYGIGARYDDSKANDRIYKIKGTPNTQPFPILVSTIDQVRQLANINEFASDLMNKHWPGGLTLILNGVSTQKLGFRMPNSPIVKSIIDKVGPIIGTSANFHSDKTPVSYEELDPDFKKLADFVIKGECKIKQESTVVDVTADPPKILRQGAVKLNDSKN